MLRPGIEPRLVHWHLHEGPLVQKVWTILLMTNFKDIASAANSIVDLLDRDTSI